jgi:hypothetical protein
MKAVPGSISQAIVKVNDRLLKRTLWVIFALRLPSPQSKRPRARSTTIKMASMSCVMTLNLPFESATTIAVQMHRECIDKLHYVVALVRIGEGVATKKPQ